MFNKKKISEAEYFLTLLPQILIDSSFLLEKTISDFYKHFILVIKNIEPKSNLATCHQLIVLYERYNIDIVVKSLKNLLAIYEYN